MRLESLKWRSLLVVEFDEVTTFHFLQMVEITGFWDNTSSVPEWNPPLHYSNSLHNSGHTYMMQLYFDVHIQIGKTRMTYCIVVEFSQFFFGRIVSIDSGREWGSTVRFAIANLSLVLFGRWGTFQEPTSETDVARYANADFCRQDLLVLTSFDSATAKSSP